MQSNFPERGFAKRVRQAMGRSGEMTLKQLIAQSPAGQKALRDCGFKPVGLPSD
jgi:hypothetical protein